MNVSGYLLSVTALIILGEIVRIILPNGKTKKIAETVFSLVVIITLLSPIMNIKDLSLLDGAGSEFFADETYYDYVDLVLENDARVKTVNYLESENFPYSSIEIECEKNSIKKLIIYCDKMVMDGKNEHINSSEVTMNLAYILSVDRGVIEFVER